MHFNSYFSFYLQNHGIKSVNVLSRDLQSLWALTEQSYINQTNISLGRYDVSRGLNFIIFRSFAHNLVLKLK